MKCYFHFDEESKQKVLIPGCWSVVHSNDIEDCNCSNTTFSQFEKQRYNEVLKEKCKIISEYEKEIIRLNKRIEYLTIKNENLKNNQDT